MVQPSAALREEAADRRVLRRGFDQLDPLADGATRDSLIDHVADRPGHDRRYALDARRLCDELNWAPEAGFEDGLAATVRWYRDNASWWKALRQSTYGGERLGLSPAVAEQAGQ